MAKKASKKTSAAEVTEEAATEKPKSKKDKKGRWRAPKGVLVHFMGVLISAGHLKTIPTESSKMGKEAQRIRQMAEKLARQTRRSGDEDIVLGGAAPGGDEDDDEE